ncbi:unnamed protein product [Paramecium octaurelia]|uniref:aspartate transaminase n=1 Tax=Paramecium octaurelia TaxID=43137 RepID=A0A8S1TIL8_PAROT|nr:unnamed protein product [Paramecium octaurelia]
MQCFRALRYFSVWSQVPMGPADPILGVAAQFKADPSTTKVNLSIGAYRDNDGKPVVLESVKRAEQIIKEKKLDNEYLPVEGLQSFIDASIKLGYGDAYYAQNGKSIAGCQVLSGTGAVRLGFEFSKKFLPQGTKVYMPNPTWPNHHNIARMAGLEISEYRYFDPKTRGVDFSGLVEDLNKAQNGSVILFHACAHNPTGCDLTTAQWTQLLDLTKKKNFLPFFDMAYQGFTSGDVNKDAEAVRLFTAQGVPIVLGQSFAKNMGLYGQRTGCLSFVCSNQQEKDKVVSQLKLLARPLWSSPPLHGARVADIILNTPELNQLWLQEVKMMANRIQLMRVGLANTLKSLGSPHDWSHISKQIGMFAFTGVGPDHVKELIAKYHIYLLSSGRISIAGLNEGNVKYVAEAFHDVTKNTKL